MRERNIDKCSPVPVGSDDFGRIMALALRSAIYGTTDEMKAVKRFVGEYFTEMNLTALYWLWKEMEIQGNLIPQHNGEDLVDICWWVNREIAARREGD